MMRLSLPMKGEAKIEWLSMSTGIPGVSLEL